jgi:hypothetical protein
LETVSPACCVCTYSFIQLRVYSLRSEAITEEDDDDDEFTKSESKKKWRLLFLKNAVMNLF